MRLVNGWAQVLAKASSLWVTYGGIVLAAVYANLPLFNGVLSPQAFAYAMLAIGVASAVARVVAQPESLPKP